MSKLEKKLQQLLDECDMACISETDTVSVLAIERLIRKIFKTDKVKLD